MSHRLSFLERGFKGLVESGNPPYFVVATSFPRGGLNTHAIKNAVDELIGKYPVFSAKLVEDNWEPLETPANCADVVVERTYDALEGNSATEQLSRLAYDTLGRLKGALSPHSGRTLLVEIFRAASAASSHKDYLVVTADHLVIDGHGLIRLVQALTAAQVPAAIKNDPYDWAPPVDELLDYTLAEPPTFPPPPEPKAWGTSSESGQPPDSFPVGHGCIALSVEILAKVRAAAKGHGFASIRGVLGAAYALAIWQHAEQTEDHFGFWQQHNDRPDIESRVPYIPGNYVITVKKDLSLQQASDVWSIARQLEDAFDPANIAEGRKPVAALSYIPFPLGQVFKMMANSPVPYRVSLALSTWEDVALPAGAEDMALVTNDTPGFAPIEGHALVLENGIRFNVVFRDGFAVSSDQIQQINKTWETTLSSL